jgi:plasmid stabilization system protein ParE
MAAKPLDIHPAVLAEFKSAVRWYLDRSETAAKNFVAEVDRAKSLITESPRRWPAAEGNTRKFVLQRCPYALIYRERRSDIQILAFATDTAAPNTGRNDSNG